MTFQPKITRGKTSEGRLRLVDAYLLERHRSALESGPFVDLGCGVGGLTTIESKSAIEQAGLVVEIWAVDADEARLPAVDGIQTSTALEVVDIGVLRAMNVLRQYNVDDSLAALSEWSTHLSTQGVLVEGTSDKHGELAAFFCLGRSPELVLMTTFSRDFGPWIFRDYLPQLWRRSVKPGTALFGFFRAWAAEFQASSECTDAPSRFFASLDALGIDGLKAGSINGSAYLSLPVVWDPQNHAIPALGL